MTKVIFKKFSDGEVIAVFIQQCGDTNAYRTCLSYQHIGQHSGLDLNLLKDLKPATPEEYKDLLAEIISIGYENIIIGKRATNKDLHCRLKELEQITSFMKEKKI